jgi:hypothetical protein
MTWWIDGIKNDIELAAAIKELADEEAEPTVAQLLEYAADRILALSVKK